MVSIFDLGRRRAVCALLAAGALVGAVATAASDAGAATKASASQSNTLRIGYLAIPVNITVVLAEEQGFFKKHGLDVKLTGQQCGSCLYNGFIGKQFDITTVTITDALSLNAKGFGSVLVSGNSVNTKAISGPSLMVQKGVNSIKQLKGKTIGLVSVGTGVQYWSLLNSLRKAGMSKKDVKFVTVPYPNMADSLKAGRIDAAMSVDPYIAQIQAAGYPGLSNPNTSVVNPAVAALWQARASDVKKNKAKYVRFRRALADTLAWMKANPDGWRASVVKNMGLPASVVRFLDLVPQIELRLRTQWITPWIKMMERVGGLKKGKIKNANQVIAKL